MLVEQTSNLLHYRFELPCLEAKKLQTVVQSEKARMVRSTKAVQVIKLRYPPIDPADVQVVWVVVRCVWGANAAMLC